MSLKQKTKEASGDWMEKAARQETEARAKKMMKKRVMEDPRYAGMTANKARQQQRREYIVGQMVSMAKQKKSMGMGVSPEEQWVLSNQNLFL